MLKLTDKQIQYGTSWLLKSIEGPKDIIDRLQDMGLTSSCEIFYQGRIAGGGPLLLRSENTMIALREEEAQCLLVESIL